MLSDVQIAQQAKPKRITEVAAELGIDQDDLIPYGHDKAKVSLDVAKSRADRPDGKLLLWRLLGLFRLYHLSDQLLLWLLSGLSLLWLPFGLSRQSLLLGLSHL